MFPATGDHSSTPTLLSWITRLPRIPPWWKSNLDCHDYLPSLLFAPGRDIHTGDTVAFIFKLQVTDNNQYFRAGNKIAR